jgi:uncharacterized membrane protein YiaA
VKIETAGSYETLATSQKTILTVYLLFTGLFNGALSISLIISYKHKLLATEMDYLRRLARISRLDTIRKKLE